MREFGTSGTQAATKGCLPENENLLTTNQLASLLGLKAETLARWRSLRIGPRFVRISPRCLRYRSSDISAWLELNCSDFTDRRIADV